MSDPNAEQSLVATCTICEGWTALMIVDPTDARDLADAAKLIANAKKNGRTVRYVTPDERGAIASKPCRCPKPARAASRKR